MENINIEATDRSPEINFNFGENTYLIKGESYPEDVNSFYGPVIEQFEAHLEASDECRIFFQFELIYFNSSSAKILMGIFDLLDEKAEAGFEVVIEWLYEEEDDNMQELGEEYGEDLEHAKFTLKELSS